MTERNLLTRKEKKINQKITSNVLQFFTEDGSKVSVRPSGTEPKIKFYIEVKDSLKSRDRYYTTDEKCEMKIDQVMKDLGI